MSCAFDLGRTELIAHATVAFVDPYGLDRELLDLDDDEQRAEYDRQRKLLALRAKHSRPERIPREGILEVPKSACIMHAAVASNVIVVVNSQNKLTVTDSSDSVKCGTWDVPQLLSQADDGSKRFYVGDRVTRLFVDPLTPHQLEVIAKAISQLHEYIRHKSDELAKMQALLHNRCGFNHRQLALLRHALKHPAVSFTVASHQNSHNVVAQTARNDLDELSGNGLLLKVKVGKAFRYRPVENLSEKLEGIASRTE